MGDTPTKFHRHAKWGVSRNPCPYTHTHLYPPNHPPEELESGDATGLEGGGGRAATAVLDPVTTGSLQACNPPSGM